MKMSDVFELPVKVEPGGVMPFVNESGGALLFVADTNTATAAAHAINVHDELVDALSRIVIAAPAGGPLWYGSEEINAARNLLNRPVKGGCDE